MLIIGTIAIWGVGASLSIGCEDITSSSFCAALGYTIAAALALNAVLVAFLWRRSLPFGLLILEVFAASSGIALAMVAAYQLLA